MDRSFRFSLLVAAATLGTLVTGSAVAAPVAAAPAVVSKAVSLKDLDVATAGGAAVAYNRIVVAAHRICREAQPEATRECRKNAVEQAVAEVGSDLLTSIHRSADAAGGIAQR